MRVVSQFLVAVVVVGVMVTLTGMAGRSNPPATEVRGAVELIDDAPRLGVAGDTAPSVAVIDAVCITNTPTQEPC